ncbi:hypothetical protein [Caudoviricetes sp.]|nr:hypothetical protein [Caudoviricetes sp.]UOF79146.1 hypothetical protein [Caudoviricetes sp.]
MGNSFDNMNKMAAIVKARRPTLMQSDGTTMLQYLMAEKMAGNPTASDVPNPDKMPKETIIHASHPEALKAAISMVGIKSEYNKDGLPIDIDAARKLFFGDEQLSDVEESEFRVLLNGDKTVDPRQVRQSTNFDGSITVELLNQDRTPKTKFTLGTFKGAKVFAQGGYEEYAGELRKVLSDGSKQGQAQMQFAEIQSKLTMDANEKARRFGGEEL